MADHRLLFGMAKTARLVAVCTLALAVLLPAYQARGDEPVALAISRDAQQTLWRNRISAFLSRGVLPIIDLESSLPPQLGRSELSSAVSAMDRLGIALMALDGVQASPDGSRGYRWSYAVERAVNAYPAHFALATNGGNNANWGRQADDTLSFMVQLETAVRSRRYAVFGEIEFLHYLSPLQCQLAQGNRAISVPLDSPNGRRLFQLAEQTGLFLPIHLEAEDEGYDALEKILAEYPAARIMVSHFGQVRYPDRALTITPARLRSMLTRYPNLYFDIATGAPGNTYPCNSNIVDVVIWDSNRLDATLKPEYKSLLTEFSSRFLVGLDFGVRRQSMAQFIEASVRNVRQILNGLPEPVRRAIAFENAWLILTGQAWK